jgi:dTDP-4-dehydrorhamnose 3,5-epimerase
LKEASLKIDSMEVPDVKLVQPVRHGDARGFFSEVFKRDVFADHGPPSEWVQDNHFRSSQIHIIRGLHFQAPPFAQAKLVRVTRGAALDVAVDLRPSSPTFGKLSPWNCLTTIGSSFMFRLVLRMDFAR